MAFLLFEKFEWSPWQQNVKTYRRKYIFKNQLLMDFAAGKVQALQKVS